MNEERKPISLQDIFDAAWQAFIIDDKLPATTGAGGCSYLTSDGRKCAVGLCLPEGHETQNFWGCLSELVERHPELFDDQMKAMKYTDLNEFQAALHDTLTSHEYKQGEMIRGWCMSSSHRATIYRVVAKAYNLTIPE